ncbi:AraC family transcriptional regulator [Chitinophaga sp. 22321]|uniref:Helix-turn-helix domain-containing protein n=1 Tax=Chitinophaga hostae TaxID=2831022 RepID=A0ABS5J6V9_9BACT|nr:AraC family transcriptional regulator [Chitinophaga hostae]MBS0030914.1 helix-turn-helix domain-containing protein [Chitinophaga hostae]
MKPFFAIPGDKALEQRVFLVKEITQPYFSTEFHFHHECQLVYVVESAGRRIIGDNIEYFESGELIFVGSNTPHVWHNEQKYFEGKDKLQARSLALYISPDLLVEHLDPFGNVSAVKNWLKKAQRGIQFYGNAKTAILTLMQQMLREQDLPQTISFMTLLQKMMVTKEYRLLAGTNYVNLYSDKDQSRMDNVFKYIFRHFKRDIPLSEIAAIAGINVHSFCRFFKSRTQKSFTHFVNELRIGYACRLLQEKEMSMAELSNKCGYRNTTHFNRFFKKIKGKTPRDYKREISQLD